MLKRIPIRLRLTLLSVLLLGICCAGLTVILNLSANRMANQIEAVLLTPAQSVAGEEVLPSTDLLPTVPATGAQAARSQFSKQSLVYMLLVVILGGGLIYVIAGRALQPLHELSKQMQKRTVQNLAEQLEVPQSHDEIAQLTQSFNEMSQKLEEAFAMQKRFSQSAAHELRTPLTVLKTKVEVFQKKDEHTAQEYEKLLRVITTHTDRLADLVKDLLDLTNMDALDCSEQIALKPMLETVAAELRGLAKEKGVSITVSGGEQQIRGNSSLLHRAFYNLAENAIKYNVEGGEVVICLQSLLCKQITQSVLCKQIVTVSDSGIGIPEQARALVFEPFYRVDKSRSRQMGGAGLGLCTVKAIVEKHQGTIEVYARAGGGTVFEVKL